MKKLLLLTAAAICLSASAETPVDRMSSISEVFSPASPFKAPSRASQNEDDYPIVTQAPAGITINYLQDADVYFQIFGNVISTSDVGLPREVVFCEVGTVWFKDFLSGYTTDSYIKGVRNGDKIRIDFPQALRTITNNETGETTKAYVYRIKHGVDDVLDFSVYPIAEQYVEFTVNEDNSLITWDDYSDFVGMCTFDGGWYGIGAWNYVFNKLDATLVDYPPTGVAREDWTLIWDGYPQIYLYGGYQDVKIAIDNDNNDFYIGGLLSNDNDMITWIKGSIDGTKVTFPSGQYLGLDQWGDYTYFMGAAFAVIIDPVWNVPTIDAYPLDELVFEYNDETKTLAIAEQGQMISLNRGTGEIYGIYMPNPIVQKQDASKIAAAPRNPDILGVYEWEDGTGMFQFTVSTINVNNMILDPDDVFYNIYLNGEIYTLTKEKYPELGFNTLTDIPYAYDFWDLSSNDGSVSLYYNIPEEIRTMGVRSYYEDPATGERYYSAIITYDVASGTVGTKVITSQEVIATEWYNLTGSKVLNPANGVYVKVERLSDGTCRVKKVAL